MSDRVFPPEMQFYFKDPAIKKFWVSDNPAVRPGDCENCGGAGYLYLFASTAGPFTSPGQGAGIISKWYDEKWWIGTTVSFICPVCAKSQSPRK